MAEAPNYEELLKRLEKIELNAQISRDYVEISNLHGRYNHLCLGHSWDKIVDELFAQKTPGVKVEIVESGVFHGLDGARRVFVDMLGKLYHYEGNCAIHEPTLPEMLRCNLAAGRLIFTTDTPAAVRSSEVVFIAVGTPLDSNGRPDLRQLRAAAPPRQQRQTAAAPH